MNYNNNNYNNNSPYAQNNGGYQPQQGNMPSQQGGMAPQPGNYQPYAQQPYNIPPKPPKKTNLVGVIIAVVAALVIIGVGAVVSISITQSAKSAEKIVEALEAGKYGEALDLYEEKYGLGVSDTKLTDALLERLFEIEGEFERGTITYNRAMKEIETIAEMSIYDIEDDISNTIAVLNGEEVEADNNDDEDEDYDEDEDVTPPESNLKTEPLPEGTPTITDAVTLNGEVLASSNTNAARSFGAEKTIDGYYDSCWCVNTDNQGAEGASIRYYLDGKSTVNGIRIVNGNLYRPFEDIYKSNGQIKRFTLTFSDGTSKTFTADYNGTASADFQTFDFDEPVVTEYITLTVQSSYIGEKYTTNVCLGEFSVY